MILLDMIWPALYVADELKHLWFLIIMTIVIEAIIIKVVFKTENITSIIISCITNIASGIVGIFVLPFLLIIWHFLVDGFVNGTFNIFNWVATFILMFVGSVLIELLIVKLIWKFDFKKLLFAMIWGNLLTYSLTAILFISGKYYPSWEPDYITSEPSISFEKSIEKDSTALRYYPSKDTLKLFNGSLCVIDSIWVERKYKSYKNTSYKIYNGYYLIIDFHQLPKNIENVLLFNFKIDDKFTRNGENCNVIEMDTQSDSVTILLDQKNPKVDVGWKESIITDTIRLYRRN